MKRLNKKGFTLIELLVVLAILVVLIAVAVPSVLGYRAKAEVNTNTANAKTMYTSVLAYNASQPTGTVFVVGTTNVTVLDDYLGSSASTLKDHCNISGSDSAGYTVDCYSDTGASKSKNKGTYTAK